MKYLPFPNSPGVIAGSENNPDLFIRSVIFEAGYHEETFHNHPNTYEFYIVLSGQLTFENDQGQQVEAEANSMIHFSEAEPHRITQVDKTASMLLIKELGAQKVVE
jgi:mannose-6-phosphate isomerase-like protein (cupin superfamily)